VVERCSTTRRLRVLTQFLTQRLDLAAIDLCYEHGLYAPGLIRVNHTWRGRVRLLSLDEIRKQTGQAVICMTMLFGRTCANCHDHKIQASVCFNEGRHCSGEKLMIQYFQLSPATDP
jgi:hypothetical protein